MSAAARVLPICCIAALASSLIAVFAGSAAHADAIRLEPIQMSVASRGPMCRDLMTTSFGLIDLGALISGIAETMHVDSISERSGVARRLFETPVVRLRKF